MKTIFGSKRILAVSCSLALATAVSSVTAQSSFQLTGGVDLVSKYVWRGVYQSGASLQPAIGVEYAGFSLGAWGSTTFGGSEFKELDVALGYSVAGFSAAVTDYYWSGENGSFYDHYMDSHLFEGTLSYRFGPKFPLYVSWSTFFAGDMDKDAEGKQQYSSYFEIGYDFSFQSVDFTASLGGAPWDSYAWLVPAGDKKDFQISQISLKATKEIRFSPKYAVAVFLQGIASPATDMAHLVVGLSF